LTLCSLGHVLAGGEEHVVGNVGSDQGRVKHQNPLGQAVSHVEAVLVVVVEVGGELLKHIVQHHIVVVVEHVQLVHFHLSVLDLSVLDLDEEESVLEGRLQLQLKEELELKNELLRGSAVGAVELEVGLHVLVSAQNHAWVLPELDDLLRLPSGEETNGQVQVDVLAEVLLDLWEHSEEVVLGELTVDLVLVVLGVVDEAVGGGLRNVELLLKIDILVLLPDLVVLGHVVQRVGGHIQETAVEVEGDLVLLAGEDWGSGVGHVHWHVVTEVVGDDGVAAGNLLVVAGDVLVDVGSEAVGAINVLSDHAVDAVPVLVHHVLPVAVAHLDLHSLVGVLLFVEDNHELHLVELLLDVEVNLGVESMELDVLDEAWGLVLTEGPGVWVQVKVAVGELQGQGVGVIVPPVEVVLLEDNLVHIGTVTKNDSSVTLEAVLENVKPEGASVDIFLHVVGSPNLQDVVQGSDVQVTLPTTWNWGKTLQDQVIEVNSHSHGAE